MYSSSDYNNNNNNGVGGTTATQRVSLLPTPYSALLTDAALRIQFMTSENNTNNNSTAQRLDEALKPLRTLTYFVLEATEGTSADAGKEVAPAAWTRMHAHFVEGMVSAMRHIEAADAAVHVELPPGHPTWRAYSFVLLPNPSVVDGVEAALVFPSQSRNLFKYITTCPFVDPKVASVTETDTGDSLVTTVRVKGVQPCHALMQALLSMTYLPYEHGKHVARYIPTIVSAAPIDHGTVTPFRVPPPTRSNDGTVIALRLGSGPEDVIGVPPCVIWEVVHRLARCGVVGAEVTFRHVGLTHTLLGRGGLLRTIVVLGDGGFQLTYAPS
eukprot:PhM_4_TR18442/c3_g1_i2/m.72904